MKQIISMSYMLEDDWRTKKGGNPVETLSDGGHVRTSSRGPNYSEELLIGIIGKPLEHLLNRIVTTLKGFPRYGRIE